MAIRKIIIIDEDLCNGCGECVPSCAEGAIKMINGKAKLISDNLCDGIGNCLGDCPVDAIKIIEREADEFDEVAVEEHLKKVRPEAPITGGCPSAVVKDFKEETIVENKPMACGCPSSMIREFKEETPTSSCCSTVSVSEDQPSALTHWPVQINLVPPTAPFLKNSHILICADCVPMAYSNLHKNYIDGRVVMMGCPKFDDIQEYRRKFREIFKMANPKSITVLKMEVPCCGGIGAAAIEARNISSPEVPLEVHIIGVRGDIKAKEVL